MSLPLTIRQGEIYWIEAERLRPFVAGVRHPHVVIQDDLLNDSRIPTTVVCGISSQRSRANEPGNVRLDEREGSLPEASVVIVSQISTVDKAALTSPLGQLSAERVAQIFSGLRFVQKSFFER